MSKLTLMVSAVATVVGGQVAVAAETCEDRLQRTSAAWLEMRGQLTEETDVTVSTSEGDVEVTALDAKPTENWFGKPPDVDTIDGYLEAAREAAQAGEGETCLSLLKDVEDAMSKGD
ncbi:MAG: hypothetical protein NXH97_06600 [Rhodobacteraceae bacterium]|nr:hypothetical protein [Paracoccaceae bacterium]